MPKLDFSASLEKMTTQIMERVPPRMKTHLEKLTAQQKQSLVLAGLGGSGFLVLWVVFGLLFSGSDAILDQRAFGPQGAPVAQAPTTSVSTAITKEVTSFPQEKDPIKLRINKQKPIIKTADNLTTAQKEQIERLRENVEHQYKSTLPFVLDEIKMISFALAASRIDKVNMRWDTLIAGAPDETLALEYLSSAELEIRQLLRNTPGLDESEYDMIYDLSTRDNKFNEIANAYKNLVTQGIWGPVTPLVDNTLATGDRKKSDPGMRFPVAPPKTKEKPAVPAIPAAPQSNIPPAIQPVSANPVAAPAGSDTAPAPAGSPALPYSPPAAH